MSLNLILTIAIGIVIGWLLILLIRTIIPILIERIQNKVKNKTPERRKTTYTEDDTPDYDMIIGILIIVLFSILGITFLLSPPF